MGFTNLQRIGSKVGEGSKGRADRWSFTLELSAVDVAINTIRRKILVNSGIPLQAVAVCAGVEHSVVKNWRGARQVSRSRGAAGGGKNDRCRLSDSRQRSPCGLIIGEDRGS